MEEKERGRAGKKREACEEGRKGGLGGREARKEGEGREGGREGGRQGRRERAGREAGKEGGIEGGRGMEGGGEDRLFLDSLTHKNTCVLGIK